MKEIKPCPECGLEMWEEHSYYGITDMEACQVCECGYKRCVWRTE